MMYTYMAPQEVWYQKGRLIGKPVACAYWIRPGEGIQGGDPRMYKFAFKVLWYVSPGPHAYTLRFSDGTREELISYDTVCVYEVDLTKS